MTQRRSVAVPVSTPPAMAPRSTVTLLKPRGVRHRPEARRAPSSPTVPLSRLSGPNRFSVSRPRATVALTRPRADPAPHSSGRLELRVPA